METLGLEICIISHNPSGSWHTRIITDIWPVSRNKKGDYQITCFEGNLPAVNPPQRRNYYWNDLAPKIYNQQPRRWNFNDVLTK